jgi:hypothetical protein
MRCSNWRQGRRVVDSAQVVVAAVWLGVGWFRGSGRVLVGVMPPVSTSLVSPPCLLVFLSPFCIGGTGKVL